MKPFAQVDWEKVKLEYCRNPGLSNEEIAKRCGVTYNALRGRIDRGEWARARENYSTQYAARLQQLTIRSDAPAMLRALNEKQLKQCEELRFILNMKLKTVDATGKTVPRTEVNIIEVRCAVAAFAEIYRMERLAMGASTDNVAVASTNASTYDNMTEEELMAELREVRQRIGIEAG